MPRSRIRFAARFAQGYEFLPTSSIKEQTEMLREHRKDRALAKRMGIEADTWNGRGRKSKPVTLAGTQQKAEPPPVKHPWPSRQHVRHVAVLLGYADANRPTYLGCEHHNECLLKAGLIERIDRGKLTWVWEGKKWGRGYRRVGTQYRITKAGRDYAAALLTAGQVLE